MVDGVQLQPRRMHSGLLGKVAATTVGGLRGEARCWSETQAEMVAIPGQ